MFVCMCIFNKICTKLVYFLDLRAVSSNYFFQLSLPIPLYHTNNPYFGFRAFNSNFFCWYVCIFSKTCLIFGTHLQQPVAFKEVIVVVWQRGKPMAIIHLTMLMFFYFYLFLCWRLNLLFKICIEFFIIEVVIVVFILFMFCLQFFIVFFSFFHNIVYS